MQGTASTGFSTIAIAILTAHSASAAILIQEDFTRTDAALVRSTAASPIAGPANWGGSPGFTAQSGTVRSAATNSGGHVLTMDFGVGYFGTNPGIYTMTADVFFGTEMAASTQSWQIGFSNSSNTSAGANRSLLSTDSLGGSPAIALRGNGQLYVKPEYATTSTATVSAAGAYPATNVYNLKLVLDTTGSNWTTDAFINNTQIDLNGAAAGSTFTYVTNPTIRYATIASAISTANKDFAYLDNFELNVVPEPTAAMLLGLGVIPLLRRRRDRSA